MILGEEFAVFKNPSLNAVLEAGARFQVNIFKESIRWTILKRRKIKNIIKL